MFLGTHKQQDVKICRVMQAVVDAARYAYNEEEEREGEEGVLLCSMLLHKLGN